MLGAIMLQVPIGWLGDKMNRRHLIVALAGLAAVGALLWPWALESPWLTFGLLFLWGGLFVGIYTIMLTIVGSRFTGGDLVGIYAGMGLTWGAGALFGPLLAGLTVQAVPHGLALFAASACLLFMVFALVVGGESVSASVPKE
jgi:MFS family permease